VATPWAIWSSTDSQVAEVGNDDQGGTVTFTANGTVRIYATLNGMLDYMDFKVGAAEVAKHHGNLIILAGGKGNDPTDALKEAILYLSNRIYQVFKIRKFKDEDIFYINHQSDQDFNGDQQADGIVDQTSKSVQTLSQAVQWAKAQNNDGPLYLYLIDHGGQNGTFLIDSGQVLSAQQLDTMLDDFESSGRPVVVVLEACYSGSFVDKLAGPKRVILTSASADSYSFISANGMVSFDQFFSNQLFVGKSWLEAFDLAVAQMEGLGLPYSDMAPQKSIGAEVTMGKVYGDFTMASLFPEMKGYTPGASVPAGTELGLSCQLDVPASQGVEVWAMVTPPDYQPPTVSEEFGTPVIDLDKIPLTAPRGGKEFTGNYTFPCGGTYSVTYYAKDGNGMVVASPLQTFAVSGDTCGLVAKVNASWNLLSLPVTPNNPAVGAVLGQIKAQLTSAWKWENGNWAVYLPAYGQTAFSNYLNNKGFVALTTLEAGEGFWLNSATDQSFNVLGAPPAASGITLAKGWNLVGLKGEVAQAVADLVAGHEGQITSLWAWKGATWAVNLPGDGDSGQAYAEGKGFGHLTLINPGQGFWVNSTKALTLP
jgi:hypothetical protein